MENSITSILSRCEQSPNGCLEWLGPTSKNGYGRVYLSGKQKYVHRSVFEFFLGEQLGDFWVLHSCDNPKCCRLGHLRLGTPQDNSNDRTARNRQGKILSVDDVVRARKLRAEGMGYKEIAREIGKPFEAVHQAATGGSWKHVKGVVQAISPATSVAREIEREMTRLYPEMSVPDIAKKYNCHRYVVRRSIGLRGRKYSTCKPT